MQQNNLQLLINEIESKAKIEEVVSGYINLERRGNNYIGLCPFHEDNTPSMSVSPQKKIFKCFSCGAAGGVITFVQNFEGIKFIEAVKKISDKASIDWKQYIHEKRIVVDKEKELCFKINADARSFFKYSLQAELENEDSRVRKYLEKRLLNAEDIIKFEIGYSPKENALTNFLIKKGYTEAEIVRAGLGKLKNDKASDYFIDRIIFPILDIDNNVIGFSGRVLDGNNQYAKYLNSPETKVFKKSEFLYNLSRAKSQISLKGFVIIVEGFMDVIAFSKMKIENVVATMGVAFSKEHLKLIKSLTKKIVLAFDTDTAGVNATIKTGIETTSNAINTKVFKFSGAKDIDEYFKKVDVGIIDTKLKDSIDFSEFLIQAFFDEYPKKPNFDKLKNVLKIIMLQNNNLEVDYFISQVVDKYKISRPTIEAEIGYTKKQDPRVVKEELIKELENKKDEDEDKLYHYAKQQKLKYKDNINKENEIFLLSIAIKNAELFGVLYGTGYPFIDQDCHQVYKIFKKRFVNNNFENARFDIEALEDYYDTFTKIEQQSIKNVATPAIKIVELAEKLKYNLSNMTKKDLKERIKNSKNEEERIYYLKLLTQFDI